MSHEHSHGVEHYPSCTNPHTCWCEIRRLGVVLAITALILVVQVPSAVFVGSFSLLADSAHVALDGLTIVLALTVRLCVRYSIGTCERVRDGGFWLSVGLLGVSTLWISWEAIGRYLDGGGIIYATRWYWIDLALAAWVVWYLIKQILLLVREPNKRAEMHAHH